MPKKSSLLSLMCVVFSLSAHAAFEVPRLTGPVVDTANVINENDRAYIEQVVRSLQNSGFAQLAVLTLPSLNNDPIEQVAIKVADAWKLGTAKKDNGLILIIAEQEHAIRLEVGQGLEGDVPDVIAKRIISDVMVPAIRSNGISYGIALGVKTIAMRLNPDLSTENEPRETAPRRGGPRLSLLAFLILFVLLRIFGFAGRRRGTFGGWGGGGFGGGGFGGGGGGGFSGGGGGFSGGGSSGNW